MGRRYIKKVDGGHGHHGGAWKVAYADFVTAMMALFMVMWLLASTDAQTRKEISNYFRTGVLPDGDLSMQTASQYKPSIIEAASVAPPPGRESLEEKSHTAEQVNDALQLAARMDPELATVMQNVRVEITPDGVLIEAVDQDSGLLFDVSSSKLNKPLETFLRTLGPILGKLGRDVEINGHTDARPFSQGSRLSNWDLSYQRAAAAREILVGQGFPESHITGVFARGASQLYIKDQPFAAQNRRLSILIRIAKPADTKTAAVDNVGERLAVEAARELPRR